MSSSALGPAKFKSRPEAKDWCRTHYPGSSITEIGRGGAASKADVTMSPDDPLFYLINTCSPQMRAAGSSIIIVTPSAPDAHPC